MTRPTSADDARAVADNRNRYDPSLLDAELLTDGPLGVGTRFRSVAGGIRQPVEMTVEITGSDRPRRLTTTTHSSSVDIDSTLLFDPVGAGTRLRWTLQFRPADRSGCSHRSCP